MKIKFFLEIKSLNLIRMSASQRYRTENVPELNVLNLKKDNNFNAFVTSNIESLKRKERGKGKIWNKIPTFK